MIAEGMCVKFVEHPEVELPVERYLDKQRSDMLLRRVATDIPQRIGLAFGLDRDVVVGMAWLRVGEHISAKPILVYAARNSLGIYLTIEHKDGETRTPAVQ